MHTHNRGNFNLQAMLTSLQSTTRQSGFIYSRLELDLFGPTVFKIFPLSKTKSRDKKKEFPQPLGWKISILFRFERKIHGYELNIIEPNEADHSRTTPITPQRQFTELIFNQRWRISKKCQSVFADRLIYCNGGHDSLLPTRYVLFTKFNARSFEAVFFFMKYQTSCF